MARSKSPAYHCSPSFNPICTSGCFAAFLLMVTTSFGSAFSNTNMAVMIFVVLAISIGLSAFFPHNSRPVSPSISAAPCAATFGSAARTVCPHNSNATQKLKNFFMCTPPPSLYAFQRKGIHRKKEPYKNQVPFVFRYCFSFLHMP